MAAPNGLIVAWPSTVASIPAGWTRVTAADARYIKASTTMASTGGAATHTHTPAGTHTHTLSHAHGVSGGSSGASANATLTGAQTRGAFGNHTHASVNSGSSAGGLTADTPGASSSSNGEPNHFTVIWIKSDGTTDIPSGALMWWNGSTAPANHAISDGTGGTTDLRNYHLKGAAAAADGGTATAASAHSHTYGHTHPIGSHNHANPAASGNGTNGSVANDLIGAAAFSVAAPHVHSFTSTIANATSNSASDATASDTQTPDPPFTKIHHLKKTGASAVIPTGLIALINSGAVPTDWLTCDGTNGTPALNDTGNPYVKGANGNGELGNTGGALTHTHNIATHNHGAGTHAHAGSGLAFGSPTTIALDSATPGSPIQVDHTAHAVTIADASATNSGASTNLALPASNHEPAYYTAQFIQAKAVSVTSPDTRGINFNFTETTSVTVIPGSDEARGINVNFTEVNTVFPLAATLIAPISLQVETNSNVPVSWSLAGGTQAAYRIRVWDSGGPFFGFDTAFTTYDSGVIVSGVASGTIPSGALETNQTYWIQVEVTDSRGLIAFTDHVEFTTSWAPATNVVGVHLDVQGGCGETDLPGFNLSWHQVVPQGSESFLFYAVKRRPAGESNWTTLVEISTVGTLHYSDFAVKSGVTYEYSIVWHASDPVAGELVSMDQDPLTTGYVVFDYIFLHEYDDASYWVRLESMSIDDASVQDAVLGRAWGRTVPTLFVGEGFYRHWQVRTLPVLRRDRARMEMLRSIEARQATNSRTLVLRFGIEHSLYFAHILNAQASLSQATWDGTVELNETYFEEGLFL